MADRQRQTVRFNFRGLNTRLLPDALPPGKSPCAINVRADGDSKIRTRPGFTLAFATVGTAITNLRAFAALGTDNLPRLLTHNTAGLVYLDDGTLRGTVGTGGPGASMIPYRPNQSPQSWMFVGNPTGYRKFPAPGGAGAVTSQKVGIAEPQSPPDACPDGFQYNEFTSVAASWAQGGTAGAPANATRTTDTTTAIFQDPASVSPATKIRYSVQIATTIAYQIGETLAFTKSTGGTIAAAVEDVYPPINGGAALTIQSIYYFSGTTGRCVFVPSQLQVGSNNQQLDSDGNPIPLLPFLPGQIAGLRRGSLIQMNAEVVFVLSVTVGPQGQLAIEVITTGAHAAAETVVGIPAICCSGLLSTVVGQTVASAEIDTAVTVGIGTLTQALGTNPFNLGLGTIGTPQENDYIHISLAMDAPNNLTEFKIQFDVGDGSFAQNVLYYSVAPTVIQAALANSQTQLAASQSAAQQELIRNLTNNRSTSGGQQEEFITADIASTDPSAPGMTASGAAQWTEILFPITAVTRTGNDQTKTLTNCNRVQILVNCTGTINVRIGSIWVGGGGQPDTGTNSAPYVYRVRPRSALTGARGNPSPASRYGTTPRRSPNIVSLPSAAYDTQIDTWDIERYGGTVTSWRLVGSASSTATTFRDNVFDNAALVGEALDFDNFEPWPSIDVPWTATVGSGTITAITVYGTAIKILGTTFPASIDRWLPGTLLTLNGQVAYTLWNRPVAISGGYLFRIIENAGSPTVTTLVVNEPSVANQPLPYLWGPDANGIIFGCGDPLRPGVLYSSKQFSPDSTPNNVYDLTPPSEPLMGGEIIDGLSLAASSSRWWQLQAAFDQPKRWQAVEMPTGRGMVAPWGHCSDGKYVYFWAKDSICQMLPGLPAVSLTDVDLGNLFPHDGVPGANRTYGGYTFYAPDYSRASQFRLSIINSVLRAHYRDSDGVARVLVLDMAPDSEGKPRMAWSADVTEIPMTVSYQPEQPSGTLAASTSSYAQGYLASSTGNVYKETDLTNDTGAAIVGVLGTLEQDAGDARVPKQWLDAMIDAIPAAAGGILVTPISGGVATGTPSTLAQAARTLGITPLGNPVKNFLGVLLSWLDDFTSQAAATQLLEWSAEFVPQPVQIRSWKSVPTSHGFQGYHHIRKIVFAYLAGGDVTLTITAYDGTSPTVLTLPSTGGAYHKVEFIPTFNKGLLFTYQGDSDSPWAPILDDCDIYVGAWNRSDAYAVFSGLGGRES